MRSRFAIALAIIMLLLASLPSLAFGESRTELVSRDTDTQSGADAAYEILRGLQGVKLGSSTATVTVNIDGEQKQFVVDYGDVTSSSGGGRSLMPLLVGGMMIGPALRIGRLLGRLGKKRRADD